MCTSENNQSSCKEFLEVVELILDDEATREQQEFAAEHMEKCSGCFEHYEVERQIKEIIRTKLSRRPVPANLAQDIRTQIQSLSG